MTKRYAVIFCTTLLLVLGTVFTAQAAVSAIDRFNPNVDGPVYALAVQPDGKILVGGAFSCFGKVNPTDTCAASNIRNNIARLNSDGSLDTGFTPSADGEVDAIAVQADGTIIIGGGFTSIGGIGRNHIAGLDSTGALKTFNPNADGYVFAVTVQPSDGKILIGGAFAHVGGASHNYLARLNTDGTVDTGMSANAYTDGNINTIALEADGSILIGGAFTHVGTAAQKYIARLNASDCGLDTNSFSSSTFGGYTFADAGLINAIAVHPDGSVIFGGTFSLSNGSITLSRLARTSFDGRPDTTFNPGPNNPVNSIVVQADGNILVAGLFTAVSGQAWKYIARLDNAGSIDSTLSASANLNNGINALAIDSFGKILVGGEFTCSGGVTTCSATTNPDKRQNYLARLYPNGVLEVNFNPNANIAGTVNVVAVDSLGGTLVGGDFTAIGGQPRNNLARFKADGSFDTGFNPNVNGPVYAIAIEPSDSKILIGGAFTTVGGVSRSNIARLNTDASGTPDSFNPGVTGTAVYALAIQTVTAVEYVVAAGAFTQAGGAPHNNIARIATGSGTVDSGFTTSVSGDVYAIKVQPDNNVLIGGAFTSVTDTIHTTYINYVTRLTTSGSVDSAFSTSLGTGPNAPVYAIALQSQSPNTGNILIGGLFTSVNGSTNPRSRLARLSSSGALDATFADPQITPPGAPPVTALSIAPPTNLVATVNAIAVDGSDRIVVGGLFASVDDGTGTHQVARNNVARFSSAGTLDGTFDPNADSTDVLPATLVKALALSGTNIILGGNFTVINTNIYRNHVAMVDTGGTNVSTFDSGVVGNINAIAFQPDGRIVVGGDFTYIGGQLRNRIARINVDGTVDTGFDPNVNGSVNAIAVQASDGKIVIGGSFTTVGGGASNRNNIARLDGTTGAADAGFDPNVNGTVNAIAVQASDGKIVIGGSFTTVGATPVTRNRVARLDGTTAVADSYNPSVNNGAVNAIAIQPDGKIVIGGSFTSVGSTPVTRNRVARLDGSTYLADTFDPNVDSDVYSLAVQIDGKVIIAGGFTLIYGTGNGGPSYGQKYIARVTATGVVDTAFSPAFDNLVYAAGLQSDGKVVIGGTFSSEDVLVGAAHVTVVRPNIARLTNTDAGVQTLTVSSDGSTVTWSRGQTGPEVARVTFESSDDKVTWSPLGNGSRIAGGWQITGLSLQKNKSFYLRARGYSGSGRDNGSGSVVESGSLIHLAAPPVLAATAASNIAPYYAAINGTVTGNNTVVVFEYGPTLSYGTTAAALPGTVTGQTAVPVSRLISGLTTGATYHYRLKGTNSHFIAYSADQAFTASSDPVNAAASIVAGSDTPKPIPNSGSVTSVISGPSCPYITDVRVSVAADHPALNELVITLTHDTPAKTVQLMNAPQCAGANMDLVFDDAGTSGAVQTAACSGSTPALNGAFTPKDALSAFNGDSASGNWTLTVTDTGGANPGSGTLKSWGIEFNCSSQLAVTVSGTGSINVTDSTTPSHPALPCSSGTCSDVYKPGDSVDAAAAGTGNNAFDNWSGSCTCSYSLTCPTGTCTMAMAGNKAATATFVQMADFTADAFSGTAPLYVTFTDNSGHAPSAWLWNFDSVLNAEGTSGLKNPVHNFKNAGTYSVSLAVNGNPAYTISKSIVVNPCADGLDSVRIGSAYYQPNNPLPNAIQNAYEAVAQQTGSSTIEAKGLSFTGDLFFDGTVNIIFSGGFGCNYSAKTAAQSEVVGALTVGGTGTAVIDGLMLR